MHIHIKSILSAFAFSLLFYSKSFGLNLLLISILVIVLVVSMAKERRVSWVFALTYIATALFVFLNPTGFTIFVHLMAFIVFIGKSISDKSSLYISWIVGLVNMLVASVANYTDKPKRSGDTKELSPKFINRLKGGVVALLLLVLFSLLYKNANPVFSALLAKINLDFISVPWLFFTLLGYVLFVHILKPYTPEELINYDLAQSNTLERPTEINLIGTKKKLVREHTLGSMVFFTLNALLMIFLVTDCIYLFQENEITNAAYSTSVHQGVYALMLSIVCAIVLILYFFRGNLNFFEGNSHLKTLTYLWIGLNVILVVFTWVKNYAYIEALGLTYKRIGVFVYLLLTLTGLVTAYIKVSSIKNFTYLLRTNMACLFAFLMMSAAIPWNTMITSYNLNNIENPDLNYLITLGANNSPQLFKHLQGNSTKLSFEDKASIQEKHRDFSNEQAEKSWQEYSWYQLLQNDAK